MGPSTFELFVRNIEASGHQNANLHNIGLAAEPGGSEITYSPNNRSGGFVSDQTDASAGHTTEYITLTRLDDIKSELSLPTVDFIKIDVEGFELQVLRGGSHVIHEFKPVVMMELNHWCLNAFQRTSVPEYFDFCRSLFPILYAVSDADDSVRSRASRRAFVF
jgi:FkbM family methyltransferase